MTSRYSAAHAEDHRSLIVAQRKEKEQFDYSRAGMLTTAAGLRRSARGMIDSNDRDVMIRLAVGYERRAAGLRQH